MLTAGTKYFLDPICDFKVGREFWNYVGGSDTAYEELLDCFLEVFRARSQEFLFLLEEEV